MKRFNRVLIDFYSAVLFYLNISSLIYSQITIDIGARDDSYDQCNALVIPSEKRKTKSKDKKVAVTRLLSKKRRKELEKVVDRKKKKANVSPSDYRAIDAVYVKLLSLFSIQRATLLEELAKVQAPEEELKQYMTLAAVQTKGLKRHFSEIEKGLKPKIPKSDPQGEQIVVNAIKGAKQARLSLLANNDEDKSNLDPNVVGLDVRIA